MARRRNRRSGFEKSNSPRSTSAALGFYETPSPRPFLPDSTEARLHGARTEIDILERNGAENLDFVASVQRLDQTQSSLLPIAGRDPETECAGDGKRTAISITPATRFNNGVERRVTWGSDVESISLMHGILSPYNLTADQ